MSEDAVIPRLNDQQRVHLSKALSYILRHGAAKEKLTMTDDGYILVNEILNRPKLKAYTFEDVQYVVDTNDKQRFRMQQDEAGAWWIRANQGHSLKTVKIELDLIQHPLPICVHGTFLKNWNSIATQGLKRMSRNHIHFAPGMPGESGVISGMRKSCDVFIYVDMAKAMEDGIVFQLSSNQVVLSEGVEGILAPKYFSKVVDRQGQSLLE
ncbi:tRNA 2'-phosphotransferase [Umbelopsis nana]